MKIFCFVILFALLSSSAQKRMIKTKLRTSICENIKCPEIEDPVCVKLKNKNANTEMNIIAVNKCEIKYAKCQRGLEAAFVPMENCEHNESNHRVRSKRNKRDTEGNEDYTNENEVVVALLGESEESKKLIGSVEDVERNDDENDADVTNGDEQDVANKGDNNQQNENAILEDSTEDESKNIDDQDDSENSEMEQDGPEKLVFVDNVRPDYDLRDDEQADLLESYKDCPSVCPSNDVMVCAKCGHNIHRTFLSACHLRMFSCKHPKEKLVLVQRKPCIQSGPFVTKSDETKGKIRDSREGDVVKKFLFCREKNLLNRDDPRCNFI